MRHGSVNGRNTVALRRRDSAGRRKNSPRSFGSRRRN